MKDSMKSVLVISLLVLLLSTSLIQGHSIIDTQSTRSNAMNDSSEQDGSTLTKLQWYAPDGVLPGTYAEYLRTHPLTSAVFTAPYNVNAELLQNHSLSILVDTLLNPLIQTSLSQYLSDLFEEGYSVFLQTVSGGTPEEIKAWVKARYETGATGVLFIGDITAAWVDVSGEVFPSDLFYMDLDGTWQDTDGDGVYELHSAGSGDMAPELYIARINAHTLTYDTEAAMVNDYFAKAHAYRMGQLNQPWRGLEYVEEDWYDMDVNLNEIYNTNISRFDYGYYTTADDYLHQMSLGQHFVQVCVHSYSGGHFFSTRPTESASYAHIYVFSPTSRPATLLLGSDDGIKVWLNSVNVLTRDRYGGWIEDQFSVNVSLQAGWNQLLCKVSQGGGDYQFSARFTDPNGTTFPDLLYQVTNPALHGGEAPYIRSFLLNGFHQDTSDNFWLYLTTNYLGVDEGTLNPHEGDVTNGTTWTTYDSGCPYINLAEYCANPNYGACYAFTRVYAPTETSCQLWMGYDDGARVWLNGNDVLYDNRYGGFQYDMTKINVTLHAGENQLMMKISQWMGDYGLSARFCTEDGGPIDGLTYDPTPTPITHIGTWLINGPYVNPDQQTRLSMDYLNGESTVIPDENMSAPLGTWQRGIGNGCPFNLGGFFDHGAWVFSQDIQTADPPVMFYNLFACGPGRFTDENYLAGSYIFHTTYGLITIASSKSGSMLNFVDFTTPLGQGKTIGEAFYDWFVAQAPYAQWEKEWYYGLVTLGDPTLRVVTPIQMRITRPENAIYVADRMIRSFWVPLCVGKITVNASVSNINYGITKVEFYVDDILQTTVDTAPYQWTWEHPAFFRHVLKIVAYDTGGHTATRQVALWKFF